MKRMVATLRLMTTAVNAAEYSKSDAKHAFIKLSFQNGKIWFLFMIYT